MWRSYFTERKWSLWSMGWICFYYSITFFKLISMLKLMNGMEVFMTLLQKPPERELSEFYDGIAFFMKLAIPYVIIYT